MLRGGEVEAGEGDVELLRRQVKYLTEALAKAKADADFLRARLDNRAYEAAGGKGGSPVSPASVKEKEYRILDVNKELGMVVLDGGRQDGLKPGVRFAVIQKDRAVATVRVVDVRSAVAGAVIQKADRAFPRVQDRAVVVTGSGDQE
jgi:hypothetical protein